MRTLLSIIGTVINQNYGYNHNNHDITELNNGIYSNKTSSTNDSDSGFNEVSLASLSTIFIIMGSIYGVLLFAPVIQFLRIYLIGFPLRRITTQKTFLTLLFLTCTFRTIFFFSVAFSTEKAGTFNIGKFSLERFTILDDLGCISFFTTFCLLVLFWIEIVYHSRNKTKLYQARVKPLFFLSIGIIYILQIIIWICIFAIDRDHREQIDKADNTFYAAISLLASLAFFYYGCKLSLKLKRHPLHSRNQRKKFIEVVIFTLLCTLCFLGRSLLFLIVSYYPKLHVNFTSVAIYYAVSEIVPSIFVIILFRKMPPKPATTQSYNPHNLNNSYSGSSSHHNINTNSNSPYKKQNKFKTQDLEKANYKDYDDDDNNDRQALINHSSINN